MNSAELEEQMEVFNGGISKQLFNFGISKQFSNLGISKQLSNLVRFEVETLPFNLNISQHIVSSLYMPMAAKGANIHICCSTTISQCRKNHHLH